jgi:hypothetical protein
MITKKCLALTLSSLFLLSACSDDDKNDSGSAPQPTPPKTEQWTKFKIPGNQTDPNDSEIYAEYSSQTFTIKDGKLYVKSFNPELAGIGKNLIHSTLDSIYSNGTVDKTDGTLAGNITVTNTEWLLKPNSPININQLEIKSEYKLLNISGQDILESIEPYIAVNQRNVPYTDQLYNHNIKVLATLEQFKGKKFPNGATCLQLQKTTQNQDTWELQLYNDQNAAQNIWYDYAEGASPEYHRQMEGFISPEISKANMPYIHQDDFTPLMSNVDFHWGIAKYNNKFYSVRKTGKGVRFDPTPFKNKQQSYFNGYDEYYPEIAIEAQIKKALENSCDYLNPVATKAVYDILGTPLK